MTVRTRNQLITSFILAGPFVFLLCLLLFWDAEPLPPVPPLPHPNGYENLVKAGNMVSNDFADYDELTSAKLRELINKDASTFQTARTGLQQECRVTLDYSVTSSAHLDQLAALKRLAYAFVAEGRLAEMEKRPADAAKSYLDTIRLGNASARGGILIDQLVGTAIESIGVGNLQKLIDQLDAKACRETAATLETLDSQRQTWNAVMQQERDWSRRAFPGIRNEIGRIAMRRTLQTAIQTAQEKFNAQIENKRQLIIEFAVRAYQLDKGHRPGNINDLVPVYLKAFPQDPFTGTNMVYSP
ncbi:MAG TPA: hypothetical protein VKS19_02825 [Verrucomicrobiae bacterium]|nr:hypothetical protein [Verrucomicrobiae bacterium]